MKKSVALLIGAASLLTSNCATMLVTALILFCAGCGTILNGKYESINISSDPPGALAKVSGQEVRTPGQITLRRDSDYTVVVHKDGYEDSTGTIQSSINWWTTLGNIILGGIIGIAIDSASGSLYYLTPTTVNVPLSVAIANQATPPSPKADVPLQPPPPQAALAAQPAPAAQPSPIAQATPTAQPTPTPYTSRPPSAMFRSEPGGSQPASGP
jgi:hypothetical protein